MYIKNKSSHMKTIRNMLVNEAREIEYRVSVLDVKDHDNLPCTITMKVPADYAKNFEKWLEDNQDDLFAHAEGGNVEY